MQNLDSKIDAAVKLLSNLENAYQQKNTATKQHIVSSIFPSKLIFDNKKVRTLKMNRVISLICSNDKALKEWKKRKHTEFGVPSLRVDFTDILSNSFLEDLIKISMLKQYLSI